GTNVSHIYPTGGNFTVTLFVKDTVCGKIGSTSQTVTFVAPLIASIAVSGPRGGCEPFTVAFINNTSSSSTYLWDFGDGSPVDTSSNPTHTFSSTGIYNVSLIATNPSSCNVSDTDYTSITVIPFTPVVADFFIDDKHNCTTPLADFV